METVTLAEKMNLLDDVFELNAAVFPKYLVLQRTPRTENYFRLMADYQLVTTDGDTLVAATHTVPISWVPEQPMPTGWYDTIVQGVSEFESGVPASALYGFSMAIRPSHRGQGLSSQLLEAMRNLGREHQLDNLILPVRPTLKSRYPLIPMDDYITWRRSDGSAFDSWMRVHERTGGAMVEVARDAMVVEGTVSEWEAWTGLAMKSSGKYVVPGALSPVDISIERNIGVYREDNVWYLNRL